MSYSTIETAFINLVLNNLSTYFPASTNIGINDYGGLQKGVGSKAFGCVTQLPEQDLGGAPAFTVRWMLRFEIFTKFQGTRATSVSAHSAAVNAVKSLIRKNPNLSGTTGVNDMNASQESEAQEVYVADTQVDKAVPAFFVSSLVVAIDQTMTIADL